jgi:hypothetical protein
MSRPLYRVQNGPSPTTAPTPKIATGTSTKTLLQLLHPSDALIAVAWGISFDGSAAATPVECELIHTTTVAATVTAYVANDVVLFSDPLANTPGLTLSTSGSGYTASAEGSVVAPVRVGDYQLVAPSNQWAYQFPLDQEFVVPAAGVMRVRVTAAATVNANCWVDFAIG